MSTSEEQPELAVGFIMGIAYRKIVSLLQHRLKDHDITTEQWSVLYQIYQSQGMIQKEIAERAAKDRPTVTRIIDILEAKGLVRKQTAQGDRRSFVVFSTEQGKALIQATLPLERSVVEDVKGMMTPEEYVMLMELLQRIIRELGGHAGEE